MAENNSIVVKQARGNDLQLLFNVCRESYTQNFAHHWNEGGLALYLERAYGMEGMKSDLIDANVSYFIAYCRAEPAGFMKLQLNSSLPGDPSTFGLEIEKLYFKPPYQGRGIGKKLMIVAFDLGRKLRKDLIWLGVIDTNERAIEFYRKMGFQIHDKIRLDIPYFKEELRGMWRMTLRL